MITSKKYVSTEKALWDAWVTTSKNGVFLFQRDYMDYHADRFKDHSLLFFEDGALCAVLPANEDGSTLVSHGGLTFGGILSDSRMKTPLMLRVFDELLRYLPEAGFKRLRYKAIPHLYHSIPAEEDLYALFRAKATLLRRDISSSIWGSDRPGLDSRRRRALRKGLESGLEVRISQDYSAFWPIVEETLRTRHETKPVHTIQEMELLAGRFPKNIRLFGAYRASTMLAGVVVYESARVAHAQYIAANEEGRASHALDILFDVLIHREYSGKPCFDFGISTENDGKVLNEGLTVYKEEFGARGQVYDTYVVESGVAS